MPFAPFRSETSTWDGIALSTADTPILIGKRNDGTDVNFPLYNALAIRRI
jgi:hypothetical protein